MSHPVHFDRDQEPVDLLACLTDHELQRAIEAKKKELALSCSLSAMETERDRRQVAKAPNEIS